MCLFGIAFLLWLYLGNLFKQYAGSLEISSALVENFEADKCRRGLNDSFLYDTSYIRCVEECRQIPRCVSISLMSKMRSCRLNMNDNDNIKTCPQFVFSEKNNWIQKATSGCESLICEENQKCLILGDTMAAQCVNYECTRIQPIENGVVLGNDVRKGKKVAFLCNYDFWLVGEPSLTCQEDGMWNGKVPTCEPRNQTVLGYPDYVSEWTLIEAQQGKDSVKYFNHHLGEVPGLVEVLVKPVDGPYEGFIFKATGNGERDDDAREKHAGVVYIYNEESVAVTVPSDENAQYFSGYAMYMGDGSQWWGGPEYESLTAKVMVRCWLTENMPEPCFKSQDIPVESGINASYPTFYEVPFNTRFEPEMVSVRVKMEDGRHVGWYSDGQGDRGGEETLADEEEFEDEDYGTSRFLSTKYWINNGGVIFGYNGENVRIWIYSMDTAGHHIFNAIDGWGLKSISTTGTIDVRAWCIVTNTVYAHKSLSITTSGSAGGPYEVTYPRYPGMTLTHLFAHITVRALDGPNAGYIFNGIDSAMSPMAKSGHVCTYGGLIYCYNLEKVKLRWPSKPYGSAVCIPEAFGNGTNTGKIDTGVVLIKLWKFEYIGGHS